MLNNLSGINGVIALPPFHLSFPLAPCFLGVVPNAITPVLPATETDPLLEAI